MALPNVYYAKIDTAATAELVAANPNAAIRVVQYAIVVAGAVNVNFEDGTTDISGVMNFASAGQGISAYGGDYGLFETTEGAALGITLSASVSVDGHLTYVLDFNRR